MKNYQTIKIRFQPPNCTSRIKCTYGRDEIWVILLNTFEIAKFSYPRVMLQVLQKLIEYKISIRGYWNAIMLNFKSCFKLCITRDILIYYSQKFPSKFHDAIHFNKTICEKNNNKQLVAIRIPLNLL